MLKPTVQVHLQDGMMLAEFWDCLRLDPAPVQELRKQYEAHLRGQGKPNLVIDLSGIGFAGSAALGGFLALHRLASQNGGRLIFCEVDPTVHEVFKVTKLASLFLFVADRAAAFDRIAQNAQAAAAAGTSPSPNSQDSLTKKSPNASPSPPTGSGAGPLKRPRGPSKNA